MSDTDDDLLPNSIINIREQIVNRTKSVNIHANRMMSSNYDTRSQHLGFDQRTLYSMRENSPVSLRSFPATNMQNKHSYYRNTFSTRGSVRNERCQSSMSVRSIDTNASVSAADIVSAFKNVRFNKYDLRLIKNAYNTFLNTRIRGRIRKRRNLKSFIKYCRRNSGDESGVEGSDSSISSDGCMSTKSAFYRRNITRMRSQAEPHRTECNTFNKQVRKNDIYKDCTEGIKQNSLRNTLNIQRQSVSQSLMPYDRCDNDMYKERLQKFKHNMHTGASQRYATQNGFDAISTNSGNSKQCTDISEADYDRYIGRSQKFKQNMNIGALQNYVHRNRLGEISANISNIGHHTNMSQVTQKSQKQYQSAPGFGLKGGFTKNNSVLLPIERFKKPLEKHYMNQISYEKTSKNKQQKIIDDRIFGQESETDDIFPQNASSANLSKTNTLRQKRVLETEDYSTGKRSKTSRLTKNQNKTISNNITCDTKSNKDFNFKTPQLPLRQSGALARNNTSEILIAKSSNNIPGNVDKMCKQFAPVLTIEEEREEICNNKDSQTQNHNDRGNKNSLIDTTRMSTDVSTRPSFMKRKLYTQTLDVAESKIASDNSFLNSPQITKSKEKNKVRKLTSQTCLSNDVQGDNNVLDLIHKIVPPDQINVTNISHNDVKAQRKQTDAKKKGKEDNWDVVSIISMCEYNDASDTYTDEEIFKATQETNQRAEPISRNVNTNTKITDGKQKQQKMTSQCKVVLKKLTTPKKCIQNPLKFNKTPSTCQKAINCVKSFWDTDFETDFEEEQFTKPTHQKEPQVNSAMNSNQSIRNLRNRSINSSTIFERNDSLNSSNDNSSFMLTRSRNKSQKAMLTMAQNLKTNKETKNKAKSASNTNKRSNEKTLNVSRESQRLKEKKSKKNNVIITNQSVNSSSDCNRSRESLRLRSKKNAKTKT